MDESEGQAPPSHPLAGAGLGGPDLSKAGDSIHFFLDQAPLMMGAVELLADGDLLHLYDNAATTQFFGLAPGDTEGKTARQLGVDEAMIALWRSHYERAALNGEQVRFEYAHELPASRRILAVTVSALGSAGSGRARGGYIAEDVTDQRRAESALAESEASLRAIFEQAALGLALIDLDGKWLRVNRRLCEMLGYSEAQLAGLTFQDLTHPDDLAGDLEHVERLLAGEAASYVLEKRYLKRDGGVMWGRLTVSLLSDARGRPYRFVSAVEDITSRRATEEALSLSQRRLTMAADAAELGVWEWESGDRHVYYSERAREICGFDPEAPILIDQVLSVVHPEDREKIEARTARRRQNPGEHASVEYRIVHPGRGVRWVRAISTALVEDRGEGRVRLFGTLEDITDQRAMVDRLAASEARVRLAVEAGRMAVFEWPLSDPQPPLTAELRAQLGLGAEEDSSVEARRGRYHPEDAALASSTRERALQSEERFLDFGFRYFRPDGQMRWLQVRSEILRDAAGQPQSLVGVQLDVTEQRESEERLHLLMREVDHRANNLLAVVQSLLSLSRAPDVEAFRTVLLGRIGALARSHQLLAEGRWSGADLRRLVDEELQPYGQGEEGSVRIDGAPVSLSPAQAQALALALHELATNAAKYGALSQDGGQVELAWECQDGTLALNWREQGGPLVAAPTRRGFGATILERSLGGSLGGEVEMDWSPDGLRAQLKLPLAEFGGE